MNPILETDRLTIPPWTLDDLDAAFALHGDPVVMRYVGDGQPFLNVDRTRAFLERTIGRYPETPGLGLWAVVERATSSVIGCALLQPVAETGKSERDVEVGYYLAQSAWGKGYATEIDRALVRYGFETLRLPRIIGLVYPANPPSRRVLEKAGLHYERRGDFSGLALDILSIPAPHISA